MISGFDPSFVWFSISHGFHKKMIFFKFYVFLKFIIEIHYDVPFRRKTSVQFFITVGY